MSGKYQLRGAWVATVGNIDWPSKRTLSTEEQKKELTDMFDKLQQANINVVFFQVRTECDALYASTLEPWSYWLTGKQGQAPSPFYDPLEFAVQEAHKRNMELHAWFNPYRAAKSFQSYPQDTNHLTIKKPEWILTFKGEKEGTQYKILDPGNPEVRSFIVSVVADVLTRYDVDGIHFDDYFYPYSPKVSTEDSSSFRQFNPSQLSIDNWRRYNINTLMADLHTLIQAKKQYVKFGISPFGIVQNKYAGTNGFDAFGILYCDPLNWLENKIVDYINPQLYWEIGHDKADYAKLLPWWGTVTNGRHLYIGLYSSRFSSAKDNKFKGQIAQQMGMNRSNNNVGGEVFFSAKSITNTETGLLDELKNGFYKYPAFPPVPEWKTSSPVAAPYSLQFSRKENGILLRWNNRPELQPYRYAVYRFKTSEEIDCTNTAYLVGITGGGATEYLDTSISGISGPYIYVLKAMDRLWKEGMSAASVFVP